MEGSRTEITSIEIPWNLYEDKFSEFICFLFTERHSGTVIGVLLLSLIKVLVCVK